MTRGVRRVSRLLVVVLAVVACEPVTNGDTLSTTIDGGTIAPSTAVETSTTLDITLEALAAACEADDLAACDQLWQLAPVDSEHERTAASCGGRITIGDDAPFGDCVQALSQTTVPPATSGTTRETAPDLNLVASPTYGSWVVILRSVPVDDPIDIAVDHAQELRAAGIEAFVFRSDEFPSLNAGYWVVYTGEFADSDPAAQRCRELAEFVENCYQRFVGDE